MSAAPTIGLVRAAWGVLDDLPVTARRVGTAITELLDWKTWCSPEPTVMDNPRRGITRQRIGERANLSVRSVTRGLAELRLAGLVEVTRRRWLQSWYRLDAPGLLGRAASARADRRTARLRTILLGDEPAPVAAAPVPTCTGAEALTRARLAQPHRPGWSEHSDRPDDLARLVWVFATTLHGEDKAPERLGSYGPSLERLRRDYQVGEALPVERFAAQLVTVATWLRHDGRAVLNTREGRKNAPIAEVVHPSRALRPRHFARILDIAEAWSRDTNPRDMHALADALVAELGAPRSEGEAHRLLAAGRQRDGHLSPREESTLLHELLRRVPAPDEEEEDLDEGVPAAPDEIIVELDAAMVAKLALAVPEVEAMAAELAALPSPGWDDPIFRRPAVDPERRRAAAQKHLRAQLAGELEAWLSRARAFVAAPEEGSPAVLYDLAEALARLRELSGRLVR